MYDVYSNKQDFNKVPYDTSYANQNQDLKKLIYDIPCSDYKAVDVKYDTAYSKSPESSKCSKAAYESYDLNRNQNSVVYDSVNKATYVELPVDYRVTCDKPCDDKVDVCKSYNALPVYADHPPTPDTTLYNIPYKPLNPPTAFYDTSYTRPPTAPYDGYTYNKPPPTTVTGDSYPKPQLNLEPPQVNKNYFNGFYNSTYSDSKNKPYNPAPAYNYRPVNRVFYDPNFMKYFPNNPSCNGSSVGAPNINLNIYEATSDTLPLDKPAFDSQYDYGCRQTFLS
uniref:Uncharacterized protein n=1 Tax=Clastoptera arizonana TaxID=38151 RepID=A0A1B6DRW5_9HEMI